jgi:S-adenosylmethionine:tRNA ribosyltransferase-isomerase
MIAATLPVQRPADAKLLVIDAHGAIAHAPRTALPDYLRPGDVVIANDAATLPASLHGVHVQTASPVEIRLAGWAPPMNDRAVRFHVVAFGSGDFHTRTEDRRPPPQLYPGERLALGPLTATIERLLGHPRLALLRFDDSPDRFWAGLARHGRPIQYAHVSAPLALWDVWAPLAGRPVAFEPPSAGFALDWQTMRVLRSRGVAFASLTHAAGISSTGDADLDARLPFDEPYRIPASAVCAIRRAKASGGRVVAIGTTVVRALEHAASRGQLRPGDGIADQRLGPGGPLRVVDALFSGTHERGTSHYELLRAFTDDATLARADSDLETHGFRTHEFGDSVFVERRRGLPPRMSVELSPAFARRSQCPTRQ